MKSCLPADSFRFFLFSFTDIEIKSVPCAAVFWSNADNHDSFLRSWNRTRFGSRWSDSARCSVNAFLSVRSINIATIDDRRSALIAVRLIISFEELYHRKCTFGQHSRFIWIVFKNKWCRMISFLEYSTISFSFMLRTLILGKSKFLKEANAIKNR